MQVLLANPRGFCAGVDRAIDIVERAIELFGAPIYVRHEVVHNRHVVERLRALGAVFVEELTEVPAGATVIFSAHGVSRAVEDEAQRARPHRVRCHLSAGHQGAHGGAALRARGARRDPDRPRRPSGGRGHDGALRHLLRRPHPPDPERRGCRDARGARPAATWRSSRRRRCRWTTRPRSSPRCAARFPALATPRKEDICYATQNRQDAVKKLLEQCDVLVVVGSRTSSNSNRLRELADRAGIPGYLVDGPEDLQPRVVRRQAAPSA